jgi:hypothetical protein
MGYWMFGLIVLDCGENIKIWPGNSSEMIRDLWSFKSIPNPSSKITGLGNTSIEENRVPFQGLLRDQDLLCISSCLLSRLILGHPTAQRHMSFSPDMLMPSEPISQCKDKAQSCALPKD